MLNVGFSLAVRKQLEWCTYSQLHQRSGPPGSHSEPWPSLWFPQAWQTRSPAGIYKGGANHRFSRNVKHPKNVATIHSIELERYQTVVSTWREKQRSSAVCWPELSILLAASFMQRSIVKMVANRFHYFTRSGVKVRKNIFIYRH